MNRGTCITAIGRMTVVCALLLAASVSTSARGQDYWDYWDYWGNQQGQIDYGTGGSGQDVGGPYSAAGGRHFAVLVGINYYATGSNSLTGCVNDATGLRSALLEDSSRWNSADITLLTDDYATKNNIRASLQWMGRSAGPGDVCVYLQSSHGGQSYGTSTYLVAYDDYYTDTELGMDLASSFDEQTSVIIIVDACHAGGLFKNKGNARVAAEGLNSAFVQNVMAAYHGAKASSAKDGSARSKSLSSNIGFITAADYNETSSDVTSPMVFGAAQGLFTGYLLQAFHKMETDTSGDRRLSFWELYAWAAPRANQNQTAQTFNQPLLNATIAAALSANAQLGGGQSGAGLDGGYALGACGLTGGFPLFATLGAVGSISYGRQARRKRP